MSMMTVTSCLWCGSRDLQPFAERKDGVRIVECPKCGLVMVQDIPEDLDEYYYSESYYNAEEANVDTGYAEIYDLMAPAFLYWQNSLVEETNEAHAPKNFLEIGAATGNLLEFLRENQENLTIKGIDISKYAVKAMQQKGFDAEVAYIEKYKASPKFDIIFSSETMEHLDNLKSFLGGVANNLSDNGTFLFYVPSISMEDAKKDRDTYLRFNRNLEHLLHFTPEFFEKELKKFFKAEVLVKEFKTGFGPCIVGAVSKDANNLKDLKRLFAALETEKIPADASDVFLKNLVITALKFTQFELANKAMQQLKARPAFDPSQMLLLEGLMGYHKGELIKSNRSFESYLKAVPGSAFAIRSLLANERELTNMYQKEITDLRPRVFLAESDLQELRGSKLVGNTIRLRRLIGRVLNPIRNFKKKIKVKSRAFVVRLVPKPLRGPIKYVIKLQWLVKTETVENRVPEGDNPLVTVVIPYFNRATTIDETLDSLRSQTFINFEVIVVNDGSTDRSSVEKLKHLDLSGLDARLINQKNQGVAAARNRGISESRGQYILCLDSDDVLDPTYLEKCVTVLETNPNADLATVDTLNFGVVNSVYKQEPYNALHLLDNNMVVTAAMFEKEGWEQVGGYKSGIGYEDWEFWINLAENGHWGAHIAEPIFLYRTALASRYIEDKSNHKTNMQRIRELHPRYNRTIQKIKRYKQFHVKAVTPETLLVNLGIADNYRLPANESKNVLIVIPWMTFGGAETLIVNYCREIKDKFNITFMTGMKSDNEWEYKFKEITPNVYHLANLFNDDKRLQLEFVSNYIHTRKIDALHVIHNGFMFDLLPELRKRHPELKVIVTMFNDWVQHFEPSVAAHQYVDTYVSDNSKVATSYKGKLPEGKRIEVIPNGINCYEEFNVTLFDRAAQRAKLGVGKEDLTVFFLGRFSEEKNPDIFVKAAAEVFARDTSNKIKFFMIGDGYMRPEIEKQIASLKNPNIKYLGYLSSADVARALSAADVFVLPSRVEGFPLSILEAMAMGCAVIASDVGAVADVIATGKDGYVVTPASVTEIAENILVLKRDPELLGTIQRSARAKVEQKYSNRALGKNYEKLYNSVIS